MFEISQLDQQVKVIYKSLLVPSPSDYSQDLMRTTPLKSCLPFRRLYANSFVSLDQWTSDKVHREYRVNPHYNFLDFLIWWLRLIFLECNLVFHAVNAAP